MLLLTLKRGQRVYIGKDIVVSIGKTNSRIVIDAPKGMNIEKEPSAVFLNRMESEKAELKVVTTKAKIIKAAPKCDEKDHFGRNYGG